MKEVASILLLGVTIYLMVGSLVRKDRMLAVLFLIGFTQIGLQFRVLGVLRLELFVGLIVIGLIFLSTESRNNLVPDGNRLILAAYAFIAVCFLSFPFAVHHEDCWTWLLFYFKRSFVIVLGCIALLDKTNKIRLLVNMYILGIFWLAFNAVIDYFAGNVMVVGGVARVAGATGLAHNPNGLANTMVGALPVAYYMVVCHWRISWRAWVMIAGCFACLAAVFMSGSRGGFIGLVIALMASILVAKKRGKAFVVIAVIMILALSMADEALLGRYASISKATDSGGTAMSRWIGLSHGFFMMVKRPVLGVGLGCYPRARGMWFGWSLWAHNTFGQLMGELGLAGCLSWGLMVFFTIRGARNVRRRIGDFGDSQEKRFLYYLSLGVEVATYARLSLGMTTHSLHVFFWYFNAGLVVAMERTLSGLLEDPVVERPAEEVRSTFGKPKALEPAGDDRQ